MAGVCVQTGFVCFQTLAIVLESKDIDFEPCKPYPNGILSYLHASGRLFAPSCL